MTLKFFLIAWFFKGFISFFYFLIVFFGGSVLSINSESMECFILKLMWAVKSDTFSNSMFYFPLKVSRERFLQSSVIVSFDKLTSPPKKMLISADKNCRETSPWDFVSLNISYGDFRDIFSEPGGASPSGTEKSLLVRRSRPL